MKNKETLDLVLKAQKGNKVALDQLVEANVGLVWSIVHRFKNTYYDKEDLFQIGCIGLMKSIYHFDFTYQVQFSTYAVPIIMGEIKRFFRDDGTIKVSRQLKELNIKVQKAKESWIEKYQKSPTLQEIAQVLNCDEQDVLLAVESSYYPTSLNEPIYEKDGSLISLSDRIEDKRDKMWFEKMALNMEIEKLSDKEKMILDLRYKQNYNQAYIAKKLGISQVQVSRLEKKIIEKLRSKLVEET